MCIRDSCMRVQKQTKRVLYWGITLVLMILIFSFSAKNGTSSAGMSIGYAKELARILSFLGLDVYKRQEVHDLMDHIEMRLMEEYHCEATIHMDPVVTDDEEVNETRKEVFNIVKKYDKTLSVHDRCV